MNAPSSSIPSRAFSVGSATYLPSRRPNHWCCRSLLRMFTTIQITWACRTPADNEFRGDSEELKGGEDGIIMMPMGLEAVQGPLAVQQQKIAVVVLHRGGRTLLLHDLPYIPACRIPLQTKVQWIESLPPSPQRHRIQEAML